MGTGEGGGGGTIVGTTPTGSVREEGGEATTAVDKVTGRDGDREGGVTKETVEVGGETLG